MLNIDNKTRFYYIRDFTDMRCKYSRVLTLIRDRLCREPREGEVFIVMSKDRRTIRLFAYDDCSYILYEKKFLRGYEFIKVTYEGTNSTFMIDLEDVLCILENPVIKQLNIK